MKIMRVLDNKEDFIMKLKDTGLSVQDIKDKVNKYMIETYERFDFLAETAEGMYIYDENGTPYLDFYAGIAVNNAGNRNPKVVAAVKDQVDDIMHTFNYPYTIPQALLAEKVCKTLGISMNLSRSSDGCGSLSGILRKTSSTHSRQTYSTRSSLSATTGTPSIVRPLALSSRIHTPVTI